MLARAKRMRTRIRCVFASGKELAEQHRVMVDEDRRTLDDLFGDRITWFADGAHCGYFYTKPFQDELLRLLNVK